MNTAKLKKQKVNILISLITPKGVVEQKTCSNAYEEFIFERDMPAKHGLFNSKKTYAIGRKYLDNIK